MKITKFIIPLVLGLAGGLIAYFIADNFGSKTIQSTLQHQIVGPGAVRPVVHKSENDVLNDSAGPVDLRMAAKKTVPAVVNVMTVQMRKEYMEILWNFGLEEYNPRCVKCPGIWESDRE